MTHEEITAKLAALGVEIEALKAIVGVLAGTRGLCTCEYLENTTPSEHTVTRFKTLNCPVHGEIIPIQCTAWTPTLLGHNETYICSLDLNHPGAHVSSDGAAWTDAPFVRCRSLHNSLHCSLGAGHTERHFNQMLSVHWDNERTTTP